MLFGGLRLIETLKCSVVTLVEPPAAVHRDPHEVHLFQAQPQRLDGPLQHRCIGDVENVAFVPQDPTGLDRLLGSLLCQSDIRPAGEAVFQVPGALTVSDEY